MPNSNWTYTPEHESQVINVQAVMSSINTIKSIYLKRTNGLRALGLGLANLSNVLMHLPLTALQEDEP